MVFIAISDYIVFPDKVFYKSDHIILDKHTYSHDLKEFSFSFIELPKFKITDLKLLTNIIEKWYYFFKNAHKTSERDLEQIIGSDNIIKRVYEELNQFNWSEVELYTYEQETKRIRDNQAVHDYMINQGIAQGENKRNIEIAKRMLIEGIDPKTISAITGLLVTVIKNLD